MDTSHVSPWANLNIPTADTSKWFIAERERALQDLERLRRQVQAAHTELINNMADSRDKTAAIQRLCSISRTEAIRRRKIAMVCATFPGALNLLRAGAVSTEHLLALAPAAKHETAALLLNDALNQSPEDFRDTVRHFQLHLENGNDTAKRQRAQRFLKFSEGPDGMVAFNGLLPPIDGRTFKATLAELVDTKWRAEHPTRARVEGGHGGDSHEQRMADALISLLDAKPNITINTNEAGDVNEAGEVGASAKTPGTIPNAAPDIASNIASNIASTRPSKSTRLKPSVVINFNVEKWEADLLGHGPIPVTPSLFDPAKNDLYYAFTNSSGELLKLGRARKNPTALQRLAVIARDRHCIYPGCTAPAECCEVHHLNEWQQDHGTTDVEVLGLLCRSHHRHVHTNNLKLTRQSAGIVEVRDRETGLLTAATTPTFITNCTTIAA